MSELMGAGGRFGPETLLARLARARPAPWWRNVLTGLGFAALALFVRWAANAFYGEVTGFMILLPAVILAALAGGRTAGLVAAVGCLLGGWMIAGPNAIGSGLATPLGRVATVNFVIVSLFSTLVAASLRSTVARLDSAIADLETSRETVDEAETRFRALADGIPNLAWMAQPDGAIYWYNQRWYDYTGTTLEMMQGWGWRAVHDPSLIEGITARFAAAISAGAPWEDTFPLRSAAGEWRWFLSRAWPVRNDAGAIDRWFGTNTDITDHRQAESALRESEERFRLMADTAPSPVWLTNAQGEVEFVNAALVEFYGRPAETFMGHAWKASIHPDDVEDVNATQAEARARQMPYGFECRFERHDGRWRWMRVAVNPRFDGEGAFQGYVGLSFDVTETREALDALAEQERRQRFLLELSDGVRELDDADAIMDHVQSVLGRMLGVNRVGHGELRQDPQVFEMARDWTEGVDSLRGSHRIDSFGGQVDRQMAKGETIIVHDVIRDPRTTSASESFRTLQVAAFVTVPLFRSGILRAFLHVNTVSPRVWTPAEVKLIEDVADRAWTEVERTRAESELAESEARFRAIADTAPVLIWVTQQDRSRAFVNQAYVDYMGGDYESVRTADWRTYIHPDDQDRLVAESIAGEATREPFALEARYLHHGGEYRWLRSFSRPRLGSGGEIIGFVGVAFDVTDARRAEQDLKRINELLEDRVGDALAEKAKAEADLMHAQRMEAVGRLTGGVAHDFNNLLTVVIGALDLILKSPDDAVRRQKMGEAALSAARRGERLTHQLLAFSRRQALRPEALDLNALIRQSDPLLRRAVGEAVSYKLKLRRGGARVIVDPAQFEAALLNLIVNARDAVAEAGGSSGEITVQTQSCSVQAGEVIDLAAGDYVCVSVTDNGAGMDEQTMRRVFEPFFTTKSVGKGTGLGLSQVYGFARQSGGGVQITSSVGEGATIKLFLPPAPEAEAAAPVAELTAAPIHLEGGRLLLVEDDLGVAAVAVDLLTGLGLTVVAVETGPAALTVLETEAFDIVLTDVMMPGGMTGIELARRTAELYPAMRIVLTSGYAGDDVDAALAEAPWPLIRKPYSGDELAQVLGRALAVRA